MKSTAGFVVTLIGGILGLISAVSLIVGGTFTAFLLPGFLATLGIVLPIINLIVNGLAIWAAVLMKKDDNAKVKKGGIIGLITGIIGVNILVIIGAIIALVQANK